MRERQERSLGGHGGGECEDIQDQNVQIIKLIVAFGAKGNGRKGYPQSFGGEAGAL